MYYIILGISIYFFILSIVTKKCRIFSEIFAIILFTLVTCMIGFRYGVGIDYSSYQEGFNIRYTDFSSGEYIYNFFRYIIKTKFDKFYYLTFLMILITNFFIYLGLKKRKVTGMYLILSIFIYSSNMAIIFMNLMRQGVAVAIFFYASNFIKDKKIVKYIIFILIGAGFHSSILFLLPLYFLKPKIWKNKKYLMLIFLSYICVYTKISQYTLNFITFKLPFYSNKYYNSEFLFNNNIKTISLGVLSNVIFIYLLSYFSEKKYKDNKYLLEENYYKIGILINILSIATFMFDRIGIYFVVFGIIAIPNMIKRIENKKIKIVFLILALIISIASFAQNLLIDPQKNMLKYQSIFDQY